MVCRNDQQIVIFQQVQQDSQLHIELFDLPGIALRVSSVTPQCVKVHQIHKAQAFEILPGSFNGLLHSVNRAFGFQRPGDAFSIENIFDLTDGNDIQTAVLQCVQGGLTVGLQRIVMTVAGSYKFTLLPTHIGSCDHPSYLPLIAHGDLAGDLTAAIQFLKAESLFVAADLQYRVGGSVDDHMAGGNFFFRQFVQNFCAAGTLIADDLSSGTLFQLGYQLRREAGFRKGAERCCDMKAHHFPMAGHCILAIAHFPQLSIVSQRFFNRRYLLKIAQVGQPQFL